LVEGGTELGPLGDSDGVLGATLAVPVLRRLSAVVLLPVARWAVIASVFRKVVPLRGMLGGVVLGLVPAMGSLRVFHVGVLVDDRHHVTNGCSQTSSSTVRYYGGLYGSGDDVPVIILHNGTTVSEVPLDVVVEGLVGLLDDATQIPSSFGARVGCLVVLDEGAAEGLPAVDGAGREHLQPVESLAAHHDRELGDRDVVVAVRRSDSDGVGAQPCLGVRLTIVLLDADWLESGGALDGPKPVGEGREAVKVIAGFVVARWPSGRVVALAAAVLVVGVGDAVFLIVPGTSLALGGITFAMTIVDAWAQILLVELEAEVILVDLLSIIAGSCRVMTRLGAVG